jgi:hypothetical protein
LWSRVEEIMARRSLSAPVPTALIKLTGTTGYLSKAKNPYLRNWLAAMRRTAEMAHQICLANQHCLGDS